MHRPECGKRRTGWLIGRIGVRNVRRHIDPSAACGEAFAPLAEMEIGSLSDLGDLQAELEPTIESCESVADWIAGAQQVVDDDINPNTVAILLSISCQDQSLDSTPICEELASS